MRDGGNLERLAFSPPFKYISLGLFISDKMY